VKEKERREERKRGGGRGLRDSSRACILYPASVLSDVLCSYGNGIIHDTSSSLCKIWYGCMGGGELWTS